MNPFFASAMDAPLSFPAVVALIAGWYLVIPLIVWQKMRPSAAWQMEPYDAAQHGNVARASAFLTTNAQPLTDLGFRQVGDLVHRGAMSTTRVAVLTHPDGIVATIVFMITNQGSMVQMVEFTAQFTSGTVLDVNNSGALPGFAPRADHVVYRFPEVRDASRLYRVFQALLRRDFGSSSLVQPDLSDPAAFLKVATEREYRRQVESGYYRFDQATGRYGQTLKGGYLMAWKLMFPVKQIRRALLAQRTRDVLRELGLDSEGR